jgi:hypothetical protein
MATPRKTFTDSFRSFDPTPQFWLRVALLAGVSLAAWKLYRLFLAPDKDQLERDAFDQSVVTLPYKTVGLSRSEADLKLITNHVFNAMNRYGTDEKTILENLSGLNRDDMLYVMSSFGHRLYTGGIEATTWIDRNLLSTKLDLVGWLRAELGGRDLEQVKSIFDKLQIPF